MTKISEINKIAQIRDLKNSKILHGLAGEYRQYRQANKALAKEGVDNFELTKEVMPTITGQVPWFTKSALNIIKIKILLTLSPKTTEEKLFAKKLELDKLTKLEAKNHANFIYSPTSSVNDSTINKYEKWKHITKLIDKTKNRIAKLEKRIKP